MVKTFSSFSFGCRVNQAEKEMLDRQLSVVGYQWSEDKPDIYIINTCAVTKKAEREARQLIYQTRRKWPQTKIVVTGCAATKWINEGIKVDGIDWIVDNTNKEYIASLISHGSKKTTKTPPGCTAYKDSPGVEGSETRSDKYLSSGRLLLKIQDGCQRFCTFCIVPYLRGQPKSVPIAQIIEIINGHLNIPAGKIKAAKTPARWPAYKDSWQVKESENIQEIILTAINTQAYGYDTGESFIDLLNSVIQNTDVPRISFGSIHPWSINNDFFKFYKGVLPKKRLVNFFHIPLQSGSNKILSLMKRGYTREEFIENLTLSKKFIL